jgi:hypothetical protein
MQEDATKSRRTMQQTAEPVFPQVRRGFFLHAEPRCCAKTMQSPHKKSFGVAEKTASP